MHYIFRLQLLFLGGRKSLQKYYGTDEGISKEEEYFHMLLYAPGHTGKVNEPIRGNMWLQKLMYAVTKAIPDLDYGFEEYDFGEFSPSLDAVKAQSHGSGLIDQSPKDGPLRLSPRGIKAAKDVWDKAEEGPKQIIAEIKGLLNEMGYWELIAYSYSTYPKTVQESEIEPKFLKRRVDAAVSLFKRKRVSLSKAASIAGQPVTDFEQMLLKRQIKPYELSMEQYKRSLKVVEDIA